MKCACVCNVIISGFAGCSLLLCLFNMATFNNNETYAQNLFLSVQFHDAKCFCMQCRTQKLTDIANANQDFNQLRHQVLNVIPNERQARSDAVFEITKRQILFGKLYKEKCLEGTGYKLFKCWAKTQPFYLPYCKGNSQHKKEFDRHCDLVTHAAHAFDNWEKIVANLTHPMIKTIDARCFSVEYFYKAVTFNWCVEYDNKISRRSGKKCDEILYTQADIDNIFQHIVSTGILDGADASQASSIGQQLERRCVNYALRHNPPE